MGQVIRWAGRFEVAWKPILTFDRRRSLYLDWMEREVDPIAFFEAVEAVGAAPVEPDARLEVRRRSVTLEMRAPLADVTTLERSLEGVLKCFEPTRPHACEYRAHWSVDLDAEYEEACAAFARQLLPKPLELSGAVATDGAYLLDVLLDQDPVLLEFGVVSGDELAARVRDPSNRVGGTPLPEPANFPSGLEEILPPVSLYMDLFWKPDKRSIVESAADVLAALETLEKRITNLVQDLAGSIQ